MRNHQLEAVRLKEKEYAKILETFKQNFNNMTKKSEEYLKTISRLTIENNKLNENIKVRLFNSKIIYLHFYVFFFVYLKGENLRAAKAKKNTNSPLETTLSFNC